MEMNEHLSTIKNEEGSACKIPRLHDLGLISPNQPSFPAAGTIVVTGIQEPGH